MPNVNLGPHFDGFVQEQVESGRFQNASEVVRAALRLLEDHETSLAERRASLKRSINASFEDGRPTVPAEAAFAQLRAHHAAQVKADKGGR